MNRIVLAGSVVALVLTFALHASSQTSPVKAPAPKPAAAGGVRVAVGDVNGDGHPQAAHDMFLKIDTLKGESQDSKHRDWIEIQSFSNGTVDMRACQGSAGPGALTFKGSLPKRPTGELKVQTAVLETGDALTDGLLIVRYLNVTMPAATGQPSETMTLNYSKVSWTRAPCKAGATTGR